MDMLHKIIQNKIEEVASRKELYPIKLLERSIYFSEQTVSLKHYISRPDKFGLIAEIKRASPSRGSINPYVLIEDLSIGYMQAGASALSVLTDKEFFGGTLDDLKTARKLNFCPILRKDFIIDPYQILEARSAGADAILLIARILGAQKANELNQFAKSLGLEVLLEIHSEEDLNALDPHAFDLIGVNSRDLSNFTTQHASLFNLLKLLPRDCLKIAESGIKSAKEAYELKLAGFDGFLIGELFMRETFPEKACHRFIQELAILQMGNHAQA